MIRRVPRTPSSRRRRLKRNRFRFGADLRPSIFSGLPALRVARSHLRQLHHIRMIVLYRSSKAGIMRSLVVGVRQSHKVLSHRNPQHSTILARCQAAEAPRRESDDQRRDGRVAMCRRVVPFLRLLSTSPPVVVAGGDGECAPQTSTIKRAPRPIERLSASILRAPPLRSGAQRESCLRSQLVVLQTLFGRRRACFPHLESTFLFEHRHITA